MKTTQRVIMVSALVLALASNFLLAQTNGGVRPPPGIFLLQNPVFARNPAALDLVTNLLAEPQRALIVPEVSETWSPPGTFWTLKNAPVPMPYDPFPELPVYQVGTNQYLIDDRSVDYVALDALQQALTEAEGLTNPSITIGPIDTNGLWLQVPTNSLATPGYFTVNVMNTIPGQLYDVLTKTGLLAPTWTTELTITGAVGDVAVQMPMNGRTNLFVSARPSVVYSFYLVTAPLSQDVFDGDAVTFSAETGGNPNLTFQWTLNGVAIDGATNSSYTIDLVQDSDAGDYACIVSDGTNSISTPVAHLTTDGYSGDNLLIPITSARQNYTFKSGVTYYIGASILLYGNTTIEGGAILKFDSDYSTSASLVIMGGLTCKGEPYNPSILTSIDDDAVGELIYFSSGYPQPVTTGTPYLELAYAQSNSISNLRICFADWGVTTPVTSQKLDVWDCQFVECNYGVVNLVDGVGAKDSLHNVLFAACGAAVGASTNAIDVEAEQVTADVGEFCAANSTPDRIALTNSIVWGNPVTAASLATAHVAFNPDNTNFVAEGYGGYQFAFANGTARQNHLFAHSRCGLYPNQWKSHPGAASAALHERRA